MTDATVISEESYNDASKTIAYRYSIPSVVGGGTSDEIRFTGLDSKEGRLVGFKIANSSDDYDISLRSKLGVTPPSIEEILKVTEINQTYQEMNLGILFSNNDDTEGYYLYGKLSNTSTTATGITTIELIIERR